MRPWVPRVWRGGGLDTMHRIEALSEIAGDFDAMLIDQFGVLHDGQKLYPGAANAMTGLQALGIPVVIMTNSGKRATPNVDRIVKMGINRSQFVDCVSSGEAAFQSLKIKKAYLIGKEGEDYGFDPVQFVERPEDADVMLILGSNAPRTSLDDYRERFAGITLPAICSNPDKLMITSSGLQPAPGAIAAVYEEIGGKVTWIGKPHPEIYRFALAKLGNPKKVLCVGDSAEHDVAGGKSVGLTTLLIEQGVSVGKQEAEHHPQPDFICSDFMW
jgi:HAD superfamily hydrolase (TIGR01459 family)